MEPLALLFGLSTLALLVIVIYLLDGWKNSVEARILALERSIDRLTEELQFLRR